MWISVAWVKVKGIKRKKKGKEKWSDRDIATWKHRTRWNISRATSVICFRSFHSWPSLSAMRKIRLSTRWRPSAVTDSKISHVTHAICLQLIAKFLYSRQERLDRKFPRVRISVGSWEIEESFIFYFLFLKNSIFFKSSIFFSISIICFDPLNEWNSLKKFLLIFLDFLPFFFFVMFFKMDPQLRSKFSYLSHFSLIFFSIFSDFKVFFNPQHFFKSSTNFFNVSQHLLIFLSFYNMFYHFPNLYSPHF